MSNSASENRNIALVLPYRALPSNLAAMLGFSERAPIVIVHTGFDSQIKQWGSDNFRVVILDMLNRGYAVLVVGISQERTEVLTKFQLVHARVVCKNRAVRR